jgi:hypothetical protein
MASQVYIDLAMKCLAGTKYLKKYPDNPIQISVMQKDSRELSKTNSLNQNLRKLRNFNTVEHLVNNNTHEKT